MSVDKFGDCDEGEREKRGPPGKNGFDLCIWLPNAILENLQREEVYCFTLTDLEKDIKRSGDDVVEWISRSSVKLNLIVNTDKKPAKSKELSPKWYALVCKESGYESDDILLFKYIDGIDCGFICLTFRTSSDSVQTSISDFQTDPTSYFDVSVTSSEIMVSLFNIITKKLKKVSIQQDCRNWTTFFIEYVSAK